MNQLGFVEISIIKDEKLFRASLPMGVAWSECHEALLELADQIAQHIKVLEEKIKEEEKNKGE